MTSAVLYRWRLKPGRESDFEAAWAEGTRRIHEACGSHGAALHTDEDGIYWSYALWPSETARQACFTENDWFSQDCFQTMQDCIAERFEETRLDLRESELHPPGRRRDTPTLTTDRLLLRAMTLDDAPAFLPALSDPDTMTYWSRPPIETLDEVRAYLRGNVDAPDLQTWCYARPGAPDSPMGWVILMDRRPGVSEIGYLARPDSRGSGFAAEAVRRVCRYGFEALGKHRIYGDTDPDNAASIRVLEKCGFTLEGRERGAWKTHIGQRDSLIFGLLPDDGIPG